MVSSAIRDVVITSVYSEKTRPKKLMMMMKMVVMMISRHREPSEVRLVEMLSGSLYWWVELCVPSLHRECYSTFIIIIITIITPHAQRERGKVIGRGVHIYIYMSVVEKKI